MKKLFLFLFACCLSSLASAQETPTRELGIRLNGINFGNYQAFELVYKKQKAANRYNRWRATFGNINFNAPNESQNSFNMGVGLAYGLEKRRPMSDRFQFVMGPEFQGNLQIGSTKVGGNSTTAFGTSLGVSYILGVQYNFGKAAFASVETLPGASVNFRTSEGAEGYGMNVGFNSLGAVTIGWRF